MDISNYLDLLTSFHRDKLKLIASISSVLTPILACRDVISHLPGLFDVETAIDQQLITMALWVGAPLAIPNVIALPFFGFADQRGSLTFGETDNPASGGYWRESGVSSFKALDISAELLPSVIKAQIYRNSCNGTLEDAYCIIKILTDQPVKIISNGDMTVIVQFLADADTTTVELVRLMFPRPMGVTLKIGDE